MPDSTLGDDDTMSSVADDVPAGSLEVDVGDGGDTDSPVASCEIGSPTLADGDVDAAASVVAAGSLVAAASVVGPDVGAEEAAACSDDIGDSDGDSEGTDSDAADDDVCGNDTGSEDDGNGAGSEDDGNGAGSEDDGCASNELELLSGGSTMLWGSISTTVPSGRTTPGLDAGRTAVR
nr:hypothetical protein HK105_001935 [Polyrhizophydium stewartii]